MALQYFYSYLFDISKATQTAYSLILEEKLWVQHSQMPFNSRAQFPASAWLRLVTLQPQERSINITIRSFGKFSIGNPMSSKERTFLGGRVVHSSLTQEEQQGPLACAASFPLALGEAIRYLLGSASSSVKCRCHPILSSLTDLNWRVSGIWGVLWSILAIQIKDKSGRRDHVAGQFYNGPTFQQVQGQTGMSPWWPYTAEAIHLALSSSSQLPALILFGKEGDIRNRRRRVAIGKFSQQGFEISPILSDFSALKFSTCQL